MPLFDRASYGTSQRILLKAVVCRIEAMKHIDKDHKFFGYLLFHHSSLPV
jgi:hypothetical protein